MRARHLVAVTTVAALVVGCGASERVQEGIDRANEAASEAQGRVDDVRAQVDDATARVAFCVSAAQVVAEIETQDYAGAIEAGQEMVTKAPEEIQPQARTVLDGVVAFRDGDSGAVQSEGFQQAARDLRTYTASTCDPRS